MYAHASFLPPTPPPPFLIHSFSLPIQYICQSESGPAAQPAATHSRLSRHTVGKLSDVSFASQMYTLEWCFFSDTQMQMHKNHRSKHKDLLLFLYSRLLNPLQSWRASKGLG